MTLTLVLGGGGGRCLVHIGVIQALEERGVEVEAVAACSTGAFVGALFAAGHDTASIREVFSASLLTLLSGSKDAGLLDQDAIARHLSRFLPETFEELELPFGATSVDIQSGDLVTLTRGPLVPAICASNAFPGLFDPVEIDGQYLVDGGILDMVPVRLGAQLGASPLFAVDVSMPKTQEVKLERGSGTLRRVAETVTGKVTLPFELLRKAYIVSQNYITETRLEATPPELYLRPDIPDDFGIFAFDRLDEAIEIGYRATLELLERENDKMATD